MTETRKSVWNRWWAAKGKESGLANPDRSIDYIASQCEGEELVLDAGCGMGRFAGVFEGSYLGTDISEGVLAKARELFPDREFRLVEEGDTFPLASCCVLFNVILHYDDENAVHLARRVRSPRVFVAETLRGAGVGGYSQGLIPCNNRSLDEIRALFPFYRLAGTKEFSWNDGTDRVVTVLEFVLDSKAQTG